MKNSDPNDLQWEKTRALLREHLTVPPLQHPDFINSQVLETIRREGKPGPSTPLFPLRWLAWGGVAALGLAVLLTAFFLPHDLTRNEDGFISQVIDARVENPQLSVTSFRAPDDRGVVLWVEGSEFIPANESVQ